MFNSKYRYMPLRSVRKYIPRMEKLGVSKVARSKRGFLSAYRRAGISSNLPEYWQRQREGFIARHLAQYRVHPTPRRRLALIAWAYNPD